MPENKINPTDHVISDTIVHGSFESPKIVKQADGSYSIAGYLVRFRQEDDYDKSTDAMGDYFTKSTDFGEAVETPILYSHGMDSHIKKRVIGRGTLNPDDKGVWLAGQIYASEEYKEEIRKLVENNMLGWSSGTASHLFEGKSTDSGYEITTWHLGLDASLTPRPAEFRNRAMPVKALQSSLSKLLDNIIDSTTLATESNKVVEEATAPEAINPTNDQTKKEMSEKVAAPAAETNQENLTLEQVNSAIKSLKDEVASAFSESLKAQQEFYRDEQSRSVDTKKSFNINTGEDFDRTWFEAFKEYCTRPQGRFDQPMLAWQDRYTKAMKASNDTDMNIGTDADGGYTVTDSMYNSIIARRDEMSLRGKLNIRTLPGSGTTIDIPVENEDDGEWVATNEASNSDRDTPALSQVSATLVRYTKFMPLSVQLLQDTNVGNLESYLVDWAARGLAKTHNNAIITEAAANGTDLGTFAGQTAIAVDEIDVIPFNDTLAYYLDDSSSVGWVMRPSTYGAIFVLDAAGNRRYASNDAGSAFAPPGAPNRGLIGYPVHFSNKVAAIGSGAKSVYFGNWNYMGVYEKPGFSFLRDPYSGARAGQIHLHFATRFDYITLQGEAIGYFDHATA